MNVIMPKLIGVRNQYALGGMSPFMNGANGMIKSHAKRAIINGAVI
jgi:hypothetical protein